MRDCWALAGLLSISMTVATSMAEDTALRTTNNDSTIAVTAGNTPRLTYRHSDVTFKPYVKTFCTPSGINVFRDSPRDHIHHHALMFAVAADGVTFWAEFPQRKQGSQVHQELSHSTKAIADNLEAAVINGKLDWITADKDHLLTEHRKITVYEGGDLKPSLLTWQTELTPAEGKDSVKLTGSSYYGLGMRFVESMDKNGRLIHTSEEEGVIDRGALVVTPAKWMAYAAAVNGKPVTVAVFDDPGNPRHPGKFFTMTAPFAYVSATLNLWKEPMTLDSGTPLRLRYGVALWDGFVAAEDVEKVYQKWNALK
jgi:hypothetical protein